MNGPANKLEELKAKARHELIEYAFNVVYLAIVFATFTIFCFVFTLAEHAIKGLVSGHGAAAGVVEYATQGYEVVLANSMVVFVALIPFFAVKELGRVLGREKVGALFFRARTEG